jgi:hypothetical protein
MQAVSAHTQYWSENDVALFVLARLLSLPASVFDKPPPMPPTAPGPPPVPPLPPRPATATLGASASAPALLP